MQKIQSVSQRGRFNAIMLMDLTEHRWFVEVFAGEEVIVVYSRLKAHSKIWKLIANNFYGTWSMLPNNYH